MFPPVYVWALLVEFGDDGWFDDVCFERPSASFTVICELSLHSHGTPIFAHPPQTGCCLSHFTFLRLHEWQICCALFRWICFGAPCGARVFGVVLCCDIVGYGG